MPQSASPVGLARSGVIPQNNYITKCLFYDPVVLGRRLDPSTFSEFSVSLHDFASA